MKTQGREGGGGGEREREQGNKGDKMSLADKEKVFAAAHLNKFNLSACELGR